MKFGAQGARKRRMGELKADRSIQGVDRSISICNYGSFVRDKFRSTEQGASRSSYNGSIDPILDRSIAWSIRFCTDLRSTFRSTEIRRESIFITQIDRSTPGSIDPVVDPDRSARKKTEFLGFIQV